MILSLVLALGAAGQCQARALPDAPYPELTAAAREIGAAMYAERYGAAGAVWRANLR
jgi:hypothetical protein